jgi:hypothetical protein
MVYFDSAQSLVKRTDAEGRVELPYFAANDRAKLFIKTGMDDWQPYEVNVPVEGDTATIRISSTKVTDNSKD